MALHARIWESPSFDPRTPEGKDGVACCDFVIEVTVRSEALFLTGYYNEAGDQEAWMEALLRGSFVSRPETCLRVYDVEVLGFEAFDL